MSIKIGITDDDADWIYIMRKLLDREADFAVVGEARNAAEAIRMAKSVQMDIMLMDIHLSSIKADGIDAAVSINRIRPNIRFVMLTSVTDAEAVTRSFGLANAQTYVAKDLYKTVPEAIRAVMRGQTVVPPDMMGMVISDYRRLKKEMNLKNLTEEERKVYELRNQGFSYREIAENLSKSEHTIRNQVSSLLAKLNR